MRREDSSLIQTRTLTQTSHDERVSPPVSWSTKPQCLVVCEAKGFDERRKVGGSVVLVRDRGRAEVRYGSTPDRPRLSLIVALLAGAGYSVEATSRGSGVDRQGDAADALGPRVRGWVARSAGLEHYVPRLQVRRRWRYRRGQRVCPPLRDGPDAR
jgi:hypothetical protein